MRILLINPFSSPAAVRQKNLAKSLVKQGHEVTLMLPSFDQYSQYAPVAPDLEGVRIIHPLQFKGKHMEWIFAPYMFSAILKALTKKYDVIHAFRPTPFSGLIGYLLARLKGVPFILEHGDIEWETMANLRTHPGYRVSIVRNLERFLTKRADAITVMNSHVREYVMTNYNPVVPVELITNGVDTMLFAPGETSRRRELEHVLKTRKIVIFHGKLDNVEHIFDLIDVMRKLPPMYGLVVIGWGSQLDVLKQRAENIKVIDRILFTGKVEQYDLPEYLRAADVLVAPFARTKGVEHASNLKVFEYLAMAKPVVASAVGDLPSILKDCAILYDPGDLDALAQAIQSVDRSLGEKSRAKAMEYDWGAIAKKMEALYERVIR